MGVVVDVIWNLEIQGIPSDFNFGKGFQWSHRSYNVEHIMIRHRVGEDFNSAFTGEGHWLVEVSCLGEIR